MSTFFCLFTFSNFFILFFSAKVTFKLDPTRPLPIAAPAAAVAAPIQQQEQQQQEQQQQNAAPIVERRNAVDEQDPLEIVDDVIIDEEHQNPIGANIQINIE